VTLDAASQAARTGALLVDELERGVVTVTGPDRATWLNGLVTCDVAALAPGQAAFGLLLSKVGKIQSDLYVVASHDMLLLACAPGTVDLVTAELERMLVMEDAELVRPSAELSCLYLHGPRSVEIAARAPRLQGALVGALDRTGLGGAVLLVPKGDVDALSEELLQRGALRAGAAAWQTLRVERCIGVFGTDYGPTDNPHEAALDRSAVSWSKGCYLGQEVVFMQDARGKLKRRLVQIGVDGAVPTPGAVVLTPEGEPAGEVTSAAESSVLGRAVALARVKAPHFEPGARLAVGGAAATARSELV
jgi:tRNA-modifying protein YgfZ